MAGDDQQGIYREGLPQPVVVQGETHYPRHIDAPNYNNAAHYYPPPPHVSDSHLTIYLLSDRDTHDYICRPRRFHIPTCIGMTELLNQSQLKHTLLLRCVNLASLHIYPTKIIII